MEDQPTYKITTFKDCWNQMMEMQASFEEDFQRNIVDYYKTHILKKKVKSTRKKKVVAKPVVQNVLTPVKEEAELDNDAVVAASSSRCSKRTVAKVAQEKISSQIRQTLNEKLRNSDTKYRKTNTLSSNESTSSGRKTKASDVSVVSANEKVCEIDEALPSCFVLLDRLPEPKKDDETKENNIANSNTSTVDLFGSTLISESEQKNKKYMSDFFTTGVPNKSASTSSTEVIESVNKSIHSKKGKKRKSNEEINVGKKHVKLSNGVKSSVQEANEIEKNTETDTASLSEVSSDKSRKDKLPSCEKIESTSNEVRSRTRILNKPFHSGMVVIESNEKEATCDELPEPDIRVVPQTETPVKRMTRTRTRELNKNQNQVDQSAAKIIATKVAAEIKSGKENKIGHASKMMKSDKGHKISPLSSSNFLFSPSSAPISLSKATPMKVGSAYKKAESSATKALIDSATKLLPREAIAMEKRNELIKAKTEEVKRKREEKEKRVLVSKQAVEHAKQLKLAKLQKDREEKEKLLAESKKIKEEQLLKKRLNAEAMIKEAEERRLKEEEAKKARLLKQEEEKRKQAELRLKMAEDAKKLQEVRLAQEATENEARLLAAEKKAKSKKKPQVEVDSYEITPSKDSRDYVPKPLKNEDDYGLSDDSGASTDDEKHPKKVIPKWALKECRSRQAVIQDKVSPTLVNSFFPLISKDSIKLTNMKCHRPRASSAIWDTPGTSY